MSRGSALYMSGLLAALLARLASMAEARRPESSVSGEKACATSAHRPWLASHAWLKGSEETLSSTTSASTSSGCGGLGLGLGLGFGLGLGLG